MAWIIAVSLTLFVLFLLFFTPLSVKVSYDSSGEFSFSVRFLFEVFSGNSEKVKKKKKGKKKEKPESKTADEKKKEKKKGKDIKETVSLIKDLVPVLASFCRHIRISNIEICIKSGAEDAAKTAIRYGELNGLIHSLLSLIKNVFTVKKQRIEIIPDFSEEKTDYRFSAAAYVYGIYVLAAAFSAVRVFYKNASEKE